MEENNNEICECFNQELVDSFKNNSLSKEVLYEMSDFFKVFSDDTRLKILYALLGGEMCVGDLVQYLNISQSAVSHQLRTLRQKNIVKFRKEGKAVIYSLDDNHVYELLNQALEHLKHKKFGGDFFGDK